MNTRIVSTVIKTGLSSRTLNRAITHNVIKFCPPLLNQSRQYTRHGSGNQGFWDLYKDEIKKQLSENEKIQESIKESEDPLKQVKAASETIKEKVSPGLKTVGNVISKGGEALLDGASTVVNSAPVQAVGEGISNLTGRLAQQKYLKYVIDDLTAEDRENRTLKYNFRSQFGRDEDLEAGIFYNPYTERFEKIDETTHNTTDTGVVIQDKSKSRKKGPLSRGVSSLVANLDKSENFLMKGIKNTIVSVANAGDKIMKPSLESEVLTACKERDETFSLFRWLANLEYIIIPEVLGAYFKDDVNTLKRFTSDDCYLLSFHPRVHSRRMEKTRFETKLLDVKGVTLLSARFAPDSTPLLIVGYQMQYIYHIVDEVGKTIEGGPNDIRLESQIWALRQDPSDATKDWEIIEAHFGFDTVKIV